jgi:hypothetical protein
LADFNPENNSVFKPGQSAAENLPSSGLKFSGGLRPVQVGVAKKSRVWF